jgi:hypothetical protein
MTKIQLIIEADSARHLASVINQMAHRYKQDDEPALEPSEPASAKGNGSGAPDETASYAPPAAGSEAPPFPLEKELSGEPPVALKRSHRKAKTPEPPVEPEQAPEAPPPEIPPLDDLKKGITDAVLIEPHGGPIRTSLETLRPTLGIALIRNAKEEHRAALWAFIQAHNIELPSQI